MTKLNLHSVELSISLKSQSLRVKDRIIYAGTIVLLSSNPFKNSPFSLIWNLPQPWTGLDRLGHKTTFLSDDFKMQDVQHSQSDDFWEFCRDIWIEFRRIWSCRKLPLFSWPYLLRRRIIWVGVEGCRTSTNVGLLDLKNI